MNPPGKVPRTAQREARFLTVLFWAQIATFGIMLGITFIPFHGTLMHSVYLPLMGACFVFGLALLILSIRAKSVGPLRRFLILTAASSTGFVVSVVLHNMFYALGTLADDWPILGYALSGLNVAFFLIGVVACPLGFLAGIVGTIVVLIRRRGSVAPRLSE